MSYFFKIKWFILIIFLISVTSRLSITSFPILKYFNVLIYLFLILYSIFHIYRNKFFLRKNIWYIFFCFFIYIIILASIDVFNNFNFKSLTDAFFIRFQYYSMALSAIPLAIYIKNRDDFFDVYFTNLKIIFPIFLVLFLTVFSAYNYGDGYLVINNLIIPLTILNFSRKKTHKFIGLISFTFGFVYVSIIASRSYFLVFLYFGLFLFYNYLKSRVKFKYLKLVFIILVGYMLFEGSSLFNRFSQTPLYEKLQVQSIQRLLSNDNSNSFSQYEGDSRTEIVNDAFKNFKVEDYLFGKGFFFKYESFEKRNTIEIGLLQELFWFGSIFVVLSLFYFLRSGIRLIISKDNGYRFFGIIIFIKLLDSVVYGLPEISIYNYFVFVGLYLPYVKDLRKFRF